MKYSELRCIKCGREFTPADGAQDRDTLAPYEALLFIARGNYGSAVYDPMSDREYLLVIICDACIVKAAGQGNVMQVTKVPRPEDVTWSAWEPRER